MIMFFAVTTVHNLTPHTEAAILNTYGRIRIKDRSSGKI
jgi:hypothetical protein